MKRGKDDDKIMGPMFPRLHVKDTGKGGPRAPPRNKMALYEQLTIPTQRHSSSAMPPQNNTNTTMTPSTSTMQVSGHERNMYFPLYRPLTSSYDEVQVSRSEAVDLNNQLVQGESRKQPLEEDDFMVPIFSQPGTKLCNVRTQNHMHEDRHNHLGPGHPMALPSTGEKETDQSNIRDFISKQQIKNQHGRSSRVSDAPTKYSSDVLMREKGGWRKDACAQSGYQDKYRMRGFEKTDACLRQDHEGDLSEATNGVGVAGQPLAIPHKKTTLGLNHIPREGGHCKGDNKMIAGMQRVEECQSLEKQNTDKGDDISETSMEDSVSGLDMNPDDVVRVQKLIAESPDLLLEGSALMGKKGSAMKKHSSDYAVKALINKSAPKGDSPKAADKMEGTAENAVTKSPPVPPQNAIQATGHQPSSVSLFPPVNGDPKMNPWSFHQAAPHQWLVPVMSPSEGLVYKPYPAHGCMGPVCGGGCGPAPVMNPNPNPNPNPAYGMPNPHCQQGMGMGMNFGGQGYFPPYGMPMPIMSPSMSGSTVEQLNQFSDQNPYGQPAGTSVNYGSMQHQSSLNQKNGPIAPAAARSKERDLQGSTASSPSQRTQETSAVPLMEGRSALPLFPTTRISEVSPTEKPTRVIRVVPQKSTRESAARIFQSIQEERRQY
ncbi:Protein EARLY FLOWERING 3 [Bienertia sinuspersici]